MNLKDLAQELSKELKTPINSKSLYRIIQAINSSKDFWEIADYADEPLPITASCLKLLHKKGYLHIGSSIYFTTEGKKIFKSIGKSLWKHYRCNTCQGRSIKYNKLKEIYEIFLSIQNNRPNPVIEYDQGYVTPETTISRVAFADSKGDIRNQNIIILGDDDLVSIALALTKLPAKITVFEIDKRLVEFIFNTSKKLDLPIEIYQRDLREPLPKKFLNKYDTFFTDPPETLQAFQAFIGRGIASLKKTGGAGYFGLTRKEASLTKWKEFQALILKMNVVITDIIHNFNEYVNWGYEKDMKAWKLSPIKILPKQNWYRSSFFRIETLHNFKGLNAAISKDDIFSDEESSTTR